MRDLNELKALAQTMRVMAMYSKSIGDCNVCNKAADAIEEHLDDLYGKKGKVGVRFIVRITRVEDTEIFGGMSIGTRPSRAEVALSREEAANSMLAICAVDAAFAQAKAQFIEGLYENK